MNNYHRNKSRTELHIVITSQPYFIVFTDAAILECVILPSVFNEGLELGLAHLDRHVACDAALANLTLHSLTQHAARERLWIHVELVLYIFNAI